MIWSYTDTFHHGETHVLNHIPYCKDSNNAEHIFTFSVIIFPSQRLAHSTCTFLCTGIHSDHLSHSMTKPAEWSVRPAKTQIRLGIHSVWQSVVIRTQGFFMQAAMTDQTGWMPRLIWVFIRCTSEFVGFVVLQLIHRSQQKYTVNCYVCPQYISYCKQNILKDKATLNDSASAMEDLLK